MIFIRSSTLILKEPNYKTKIESSCINEFIRFGIEWLKQSSQCALLVKTKSYFHTSPNTCFPYFYFILCFISKINSLVVFIHKYVTCVMYTHIASSNIEPRGARQI